MKERGDPHDPRVLVGLVTVFGCEKMDEKVMFYLRGIDVLDAAQVAEPCMLCRNGILPASKDVYTISADSQFSILPSPLIWISQHLLSPYKRRSVFEATGEDSGTDLFHILFTAQLYHSHRP